MKTFSFPKSKKHPKTVMNDQACYVVAWYDRTTGRRKGAAARATKALALGLALRKKAEGFRVECEVQYYGGWL